jgi:hypothetical protein
MIASSFFQVLANISDINDFSPGLNDNAVGRASPLNPGLPKP